MTQPRNSPGQALPEEGLLRDPFPCPSSSWAQRGGTSGTELGNCVARRGDSEVVAAQAILEQLEPPHFARLAHHRGSLKSFLNPNDRTLQQGLICTCCNWALGGKQALNAQRLQGKKSLAHFYWCSHETAPQWKNQLLVGAINMGNNLWQSPGATAWNRQLVRVLQERCAGTNFPGSRGPLAGAS